MSDRPTPETDAVLARLVKNQAGNSCDAVVIHHARKLERERDEEREDLEFRRGLYRVQEEYLESEKNTRNTIIAKGLELKKQLDEAREALKHIEEYGTEEINSAIELRQKLAQALVDLDNMQDQRDLAMKVIKRLERERAEAREDLRLFKHDKKHLCDSHRDKRGNCMVCSMEEAK